MDCTRCKWFRPSHYKPDQGDCCFDPPTITPEGTYYPEVGNNDRCHNFTPLHPDDQA